MTNDWKIFIEKQNRSLIFKGLSIVLVGILLFFVLCVVIQNYGNEIFAVCSLGVLLPIDFLLLKSEKYKKIYKEQTPIYEYIYVLSLFDQTKKTYDKIIECVNRDTFDKGYAKALIKKEMACMTIFGMVLTIFAAMVSVIAGEKESIIILWVIIVLIFIVASSFLPTWKAVVFIESILNNQTT